MGEQVPTREPPTNCQQEPGFPGAETVCMSLRYPDMTCHLPTMRCSLQAPHAIADCGEFND